MALFESGEGGRAGKLDGDGDRTGSRNESGGVDPGPSIDDEDLVTKMNHSQHASLH